MRSFYFTRFLSGRIYQLPCSFIHSTLLDVLGTQTFSLSCRVTRVQATTDLREKAVHQTDSLDSEGDAVMEKKRYPLPWRGGDCNPVKRSRKRKHTFGFWPARVADFVDTVGEPTQHLCSNSFSLPPSLLEAGQAKSHFHSLPSS